MWQNCCSYLICIQLTNKGQLDMPFYPPPPPLPTPPPPPPPTPAVWDDKYICLWDTSSW